MAVKNLQTLALCVANKRGVRVTGMECNGSLTSDGKFQAHFLSLLWHPLPGPYPIRTGPNADAKLAEPDQASTAEANTVQRTGRSASRAGVHTSISVARCASTTVLSTQTSLLRAMRTGEGRLAKRSTNEVLG